MKASFLVGECRLLTYLIKISSIIFDNYILLNVHWVKLKVLHSEEINQEEPVPYVLPSCCGWP